MSPGWRRGAAAACAPAAAAAPTAAAGLFASAAPSPRRPPAHRRAPAPLLVLLLACAAAAALPAPALAQPGAGAGAAAPQAPLQVRTPAELLAAINGGAAATIHLMAPMVLPEGWGPARASRPLLIMSPFRVILDWCDAECRVSHARACGGGGRICTVYERGAVGKSCIRSRGQTYLQGTSSGRAIPPHAHRHALSHPRKTQPAPPHAQASPAPAAKLILEDGASIVWNRLFFRNFLPPAPPGAAGASRRAALLASSPTKGSAAAGAAAKLDWESPTPFVTSAGGTALYNLIVWHFQPSMQWVFGEAPGSNYW
jgi:hypothetical protein